MSKELSEETNLNISIKSLIGIGIALSTLIGMWFALQADIQEAKELPIPPIERIEFDMKDELIRQTIMDTQEDVEDILNALEKIDDRLYELQKNQ